MGRWKRGRERDLQATAFLLKHFQTGQPETSSWELNPAPSHTVAGTQVLEPSSMRLQETEPRHCDVGLGHPKMHLNCYAKHPFSVLVQKVE